MFLGLLDRSELGNWKSQIQAQRARYEQLANKLRLHIRRPGEDASQQPPPGQLRSRTSSSAEDPKVDNPLSTEAASTWTNRFADHELCEQIRHDLNRTHQHLPFFCRPDVQAMMFNVLYMWAKEESTDEKGR